jgi:hypothetical protein
MTRAGTVLLLVAALGIAACASIAPVAEPLKVVMVIHSGQPDPEAEVADGRKVAEIRRRLTGLPAAPTPGWILKGLLGYRGMMIRNAGVVGTPESVLAYQGTIVVYDPYPVPRRFLRDDRDLEAYLRSLFP